MDDYWKQVFPDRDQNRHVRNVHSAITIVTGSGGSYTINNNTIGFANSGGMGTTSYAGAVATRYSAIDLTLPLRLCPMFRATRSVG